MLADGGARDGRQVIPADWVKAATSSQAPYPGYGYQTWVSMQEDRFSLRGNSGQSVSVHPATRTVVVHTGVYRMSSNAVAAVHDNFFDGVLKALGH